MDTYIHADINIQEFHVQIKKKFTTLNFEADVCGHQRGRRVRASGGKRSPLLTHLASCPSSIFFTHATRGRYAGVRRQHLLLSQRSAHLRVRCLLLPSCPLPAPRRQSSPRAPAQVGCAREEETKSPASPGPVFPCRPGRSTLCISILLFFSRLASPCRTFLVPLADAPQQPGSDGSQWSGKASPPQLILPADALGGPAQSLFRQGCDCTAAPAHISVMLASGPNVFVSLNGFASAVLLRSAHVNGMAAETPEVAARRVSAEISQLLAGS